MPIRLRSFRFESLPASFFYVTLVLCGIVTVLPGPVLPAISARWMLTDTQAGALFTAQFACSIFGSTVSSYLPRPSIALGILSISMGMAIFAFGNYPAALVAFGLVGIGQGSVVSAINLIFGTTYPDHRGALLTRVNFYWGLGAVLSPQLVALAEREHALRILLLLLAACAFLSFISFLPLLRHTRKSHAQSVVAEEPAAHVAFGLPVFLLFSTILFLYVGSETTISGWIATYAHRFGQLSPERASFFVSAFWLSLLVGRALVTFLLHRFSEGTLLLGGLALAVSGLGLLLFPHSAGLVLFAVVVLSLGCAPIFPLSVSRMFARIGRTRHAGWAFGICGAGGAVIPWITGIISQHSGSLRIAFLAPLAAIAGILVCVLAERSLPSTKSVFNQK